MAYLGNKNAIALCRFHYVKEPVYVWKDIQNNIKAGKGKDLYPEGTEFTTIDQETGNIITWVVVAHDHYTPVDTSVKHTMTLEMKHLVSRWNGIYKPVQFSAPQALYYAESGLTAGMYCFQSVYQWWYGADDTYNKHFYFTLEKDIPAGGQIVLNAEYNKPINGKTVSTYADAYSTTPIETVTVSESVAQKGLLLGATDGTWKRMNHMHRVLFGSNNYAQSALNQWLNSDGDAGNVCQPQTPFDRPPVWNNEYSGFLKSLPPEFLECVQAVKVPCRTNDRYETSGYEISKTYNLETKFFVYSRPEIWNEYENSAIKDGTRIQYVNENYYISEDGEAYAGYYPKTDIAGKRHNRWLRTPSPNYASFQDVVLTEGSINNNSCNAEIVGVAPVCNIG